MDGFDNTLNSRTLDQQSFGEVSAHGAAAHDTGSPPNGHPDPSVSIVIPARNEATSLRVLLPELRARYPDYRVIVVDDGSTDDTCAVARQHGADVISHPYRLGNGAAVKAGARACTSEIIVFMDGDGQHRPVDIQQLLDKLAEGYDMIIGARDWNSQATLGRGIANSIYNRLASWMVGHRVDDLTSGFRAVRNSRFRDFICLIPNGFSYPTTVTMAFFRAGYKVAFTPLEVRKRRGRSHLRPLTDGLRFLFIIFRVGTLYSPLKLFSTISMFFFVLGIGYYGYSFFSQGRFTNMTALLFITSVLVFLIGLLSEQVTNLLYVEVAQSNTQSPSRQMIDSMHPDHISSSNHSTFPYAQNTAREIGRPNAPIGRKQSGAAANAAKTPRS